MGENATTPRAINQTQLSRIEHAFPTPPRGTPPDPLFRVNGRISPAAEKLLSMKFQRAKSTPPETTSDNLFHTARPGAIPGLPDVSNLEHSWQRLTLSRKKSQYYSDAFAYRDTNQIARDRVARDSVVLAELKLSCCLESEQEFLIDLSFRLSEIYQRPASCIMVMVATEIAMLIGGSLEPAYHMTITALPSEIAATKNKRSTHLIQDFIFDALHIIPKRGVVRFEAVPEENLATNGMTALQEIEQLEKHSSDDEGILRTISRQKSRRSKNSSMPIFTESGKTQTQALRASTPSQVLFGTSNIGVDAKSTIASGTERKRVRRRKRIMAFFKK